jgi:hypothetical protein
MLAQAFKIMSVSAGNASLRVVPGFELAGRRQGRYKEGSSIGVCAFSVSQDNISGREMFRAQMKAAAGCDVAYDLAKLAASEKVDDG